MEGSDGLLEFKEEELESVRRTKAWMTDPKYFKRVQVSVGASMKMLSHAVSGVEKGMKATMGKPVEVMGLMLGRPSTEQLDTLIVTDVFPLPVEGAETRVLADDQEVINYMINLGESLEKTRKERFMGWYHSHPFDVEVYSHCFLSATDVQTQLAWQRSEDPNGNPWLAIVIDPLRSLAKGRPEMGAFRVYPVDHTAPPNETPDGKFETDDKARVERWGSCWNRYHTLNISYFMSSLGSKVLDIVSKNYLWMNTITSTPMLEPENRDRFAERIFALKEKLNASDGQFGQNVSTRMLSYMQSTESKAGTREDSALDKATQSGCELSIEQCQGQTAQLAKYLLFMSNNSKPSNP